MKVADLAGLERHRPAQRADERVDPSGVRRTMPSSRARSKSATGSTASAGSPIRSCRDQRRPGSPPSKRQGHRAVARHLARASRWIGPVGEDDLIDGRVAPAPRGLVDDLEPGLLALEVADVERVAAHRRRRCGPRPGGRPCRRRAAAGPAVCRSAPPPIRKWMNLRSIVNSGLVSVPLYSSAAAGSSPCRITCVLTNPLPS